MILMTVFECTVIMGMLQFIELSQTKLNSVWLNTVKAKCVIFIKSEPNSIVLQRMFPAPLSPVVYSQATACDKR